MWIEEGCGSVRTNVLGRAPNQRIYRILNNIVIKCINEHTFYNETKLCKFIRKHSETSIVTGVARL